MLRQSAVSPTTTSLSYSSNQHLFLARASRRAQCHACRPATSRAPLLYDNNLAKIEIRILLILINITRNLHTRRSRDCRSAIACSLTYTTPTTCYAMTTLCSLHMRTPILPTCSAHLKDDQPILDLESKLESAPLCGLEHVSDHHCPQHDQVFRLQSEHLGSQARSYFVPLPYSLQQSSDIGSQVDLAIT